MHIGRGANVHQVDVPAVQQQVMVVQNVARDAVLLGALPGFFGHNIHQGNDPAPLRKGQVCLDVRRGNAAQAHNGHTNHRKFPLIFSPGRRVRSGGVSV